MKRPRLAPRPSYAQVAKNVTVPPPIGGWNARDPLPAMAPGDAIVLDNIIPGTGSASLRKGFSAWATGVTGNEIESLMEYAPPSGTNKLFAATDSGIFDVSTQATATVAVASSSSGRYQHCMFATSGGNFLCAVNGNDNYRTYDGSSWADRGATLLGVTSSTLISVTPHAERLWFIEKNTLNAWYLNVASITGTATKFALGAFCRLGGSLQAIGSWSRDGGSGPDDLLAFITSKGEVLIYSGTDPSSATTWSKVGTFRIPEPIGRRCVIKVGADLAVLTSQGLIPLSQVLPSSGSQQIKQAATDKIINAYRSFYKVGGTLFGWQAIEYPQEKLLFVNIPSVEGERQYQAVMNMDTGAWCQFKGLNAGCWSLLGDRLMFGGNDGIVYRYGTDYFDVDEPIQATFLLSYTDCGIPGQQKRFVGARPLIRGPTDYSPTIEVKVDYDNSPVSQPAAAAPSSGSLWDVAIWDEAFWDTSSVSTSGWQAVNGVGLVGAIGSNITLAQEFQLNTTDLMFEPGGVL